MLYNIEENYKIIIFVKGIFIPQNISKIHPIDLIIHI
jgi:hypothetical protein